MTCAEKIRNSKSSFSGLVLHLLCEVQPSVVDVVLGEGGHWLWSLPQRQVAVVGLTDDEVVQLLRRGVMVLNLETSINMALLNLMVKVTFIKSKRTNSQSTSLARVFSLCKL